MAYTHAITTTLTTSGGSIAGSGTYTGSSRAGFDESVANASTDLRINVAIDVSAVKSLYLLSDQDVTIETNSGSSPADTLTLQAGIPYVWNTDSYDAFLLTVDVTAMFVTNNSGSTARIQLEVISDATP